MSHWNHILCDGCFLDIAPQRVPHRVVSVTDEKLYPVCCRCGSETLSGIFYRDDPKGYKYCGLNEGGPHAA